MQIRFAYATNGLKIYRIDMKLGQEEEVDRFPTPEELYDATFAEANDGVINYSVFLLRTRVEHGNQGTIRKTLFHVLLKLGQRRGPHLTDRNRNWKDRNQLPNRMETVPFQVVIAKRWHETPSHSIS